jgi:hypothetical protein
MGDSTLEGKRIRKIHELQSSTYLNLISIVQGAAFSYLAFTVTSNVHTLLLHEWVLTVTTFILIILTFNEYVIGVSTFGWVQDLLDSSIPFLVGASEVWLIASITSTLAWWYWAMAVFCLFGLLAFLHQYWKAKMERQNAEVCERMGGHIRFTLLYMAISVLFFSTLAVIRTYVASNMIWINLLSLIAALSVFGFTVRTWVYWRKTVSVLREIEK